LFALDDGTSTCAVVHLTYSKKREANANWPHTKIFASLGAWREECMLPDHKEYFGT
jgi:hypothetical protein